MFERIKRALGNAADALRRFVGITKKTTAQAEQVRTIWPGLTVARNQPRRVKDMIPRSSFTKTGPGVRANLRRALAGMNRWQRLIAKANGWDQGMVDDDGNLVGKA